MKKYMLASFVLKNKSEGDLIKKARKGNSKAFEEIILNYKAYMYKIAYSYVKNQDSALDIVQESVCKAWVNIHTLKKDTLFKHWVAKIIVNTSINYLKKEKKVIYLDEENPLIAPEGSISIEEKIDLYNAIDLLKPKYKTVIILKYFDDMKIEEIALVLDLPVNTVKTQLKRAKESLVNILEEGSLNE